MSITWNESLAVDVTEIDQQHQELFKRINLLVEACNQGKGEESVRGLILFLHEYVVEHFTAEEKLQLQSRYPHYVAHRAKHAEFVSMVVGLENALAEHGPTSAFVATVNKVTVDWLVQHINKVDRGLGLHIAAQELGRA